MERDEMEKIINQSQISDQNPFENNLDISHIYQKQEEQSQLDLEVMFSGRFGSQDKV